MGFRVKKTSPEAIFEYSESKNDSFLVNLIKKARFLYECFSVIFTLSFLCLIIFGFINSGKPPRHELSIKSKELAEKIGLTEEGVELLQRNKIFYFSDLSKIKKICSNSGHGSNNVTFGCYMNRKIYIYFNDDKRFNGLTESVFAHEFLHSVYHEISNDKKMNINRMLTKAMVNSEYSKRMSVYKDSHDIDSEIFAVLGTEDFSATNIRKIYYPYFKDVKKVIQFNTNSRHYTVSIEKDVQTKDEKIIKLKESLAKIKKEISMIKKKHLLAEIDFKRTKRKESLLKLNRLADLGNKKIKKLNNLVTNLNKLIVSRNKSVTEYRKLASVLSILDDSAEFHEINKKGSVKL